MSREHYGGVDEQVSAAVRADMPETAFPTWTRHRRRSRRRRSLLTPSIG